MTDADSSETRNPGADPATDSAREPAPHPVLWGTLIATGVALLFLTWGTVAASWYDLGALNVVIALGIAFLKATVVALYFMHLRWEHPFNRLVVVSALTFLILFLGLCMLDTQSYRSDVHPGDATFVKEKLDVLGSG